MNSIKKNQKIDLDGFPVLRIDQIPFIDTNILEKAQNDVAELILKMNLEGDKSQKSFVYYLNKQLDEMEKEIAKRVAETRVFALLDGNNDLSNLEFRSKQPLFQRSISPESTQSTTSSEVPNRSINEKPKFEPIPLPSEIRKQSMQPQTPQSSRSEQNIQPSVSKCEEKIVSEEMQPKRPKSGQPSRRSVAVVEENFGSSFVVGAIEKRKRFYPKKAPKETEAEIREKNRESRLSSLELDFTIVRRQIAMKRLLERKEKQIERKEVKNSFIITY